MNDKAISLDKFNKLNNEYEQIVEKLTEKLSNKDISLDEYEEKVHKLDNIPKQEKQELEKILKESEEYINSNEKDKAKVMEKINQLNKEKQEYVKGK